MSDNKDHIIPDINFVGEEHGYKVFEIDTIDLNKSKSTATPIVVNTEEFKLKDQPKEQVTDTDVTIEEESESDRIWRITRNMAGGT